MFEAAGSNGVRNKILVVDDEETLCLLLAEAMEEQHDVTTCHTGADALRLIDENAFDVVVTDLRLPDITGLDILKHAKEKDEYVEVIMVTGYASLESATRATNLGAASYLIKPLSLDEFFQQLERAVASRSFHRKSLEIMQAPNGMAPDVKSHFCDVTTLYHFSRKMMLSLELPEIFQVILDDTNERMDTDMCAIGINLLEFSEIFAMPHHGATEEKSVREAILQSWSPGFEFLDKSSFERGETLLTVFGGRQGSAKDLSGLSISSIPMVVKGKTIGTLVLFSKDQRELNTDTYQFLHVYTSLISSIVEHAYIDMQAQLLAKTDSLTGIANFRLFNESLAREISRADRKKTSFTLTLIDIDDFKKINDTHGHLVGDKVLKDLTRRISAIIRKGDLVARYGGEEFALILPDTTVEGAEILAERIRKGIAERPIEIGAKSIEYTISLGLSLYDGNDPREKNQLIGDADRALYASKANGKNCVTVH